MPADSLPGSARRDKTNPASPRDPGHYLVLIAEAPEGHATQGLLSDFNYCSLYPEQHTRVNSELIPFARSPQHRGARTRAHTHILTQARMHAPTVRGQHRRLLYSHVTANTPAVGGLFLSQRLRDRPRYLPLRL